MEAMSPNHTIQHKEQTFLANILENLGKCYALLPPILSGKKGRMAQTIIIIKLFIFQYIAIKKSKHPIPIVKISVTKG